MAEETPNVGPRQAVQPGPQPAPPPSKGMPGVAPPPPLPPNADKIIAEQQAQVAAQVAEAQRRAQQGQPITGEPQAPAPSPIPGLSAEQVIAGYPQAQPPGQPQVRQQGFGPPQAAAPNQFAAYTPQQDPDKEVVRWYPGRNSDIKIELTDCIIVGIPEQIFSEPDPQAKVVLALFSEILALRARLQFLEEGGGAAAQLPPDLLQRLHRVEAAVFEQANAMQQRARGVREQIEMLTQQGLSPEDVLAALQSQSAAAEAHVAQSGRVAGPAGEPGGGEPGAG